MDQLMWNDLKRIKSSDLISEMDASAKLWIWNPQSKPPHIGLSIGEEYFSLRFHKVEIAFETVQICEKVVRTNIPLIIIFLKSKINCKDVEAIFSKFTSCATNQCSCMLPILKSMNIENQHWLLREFLAHLDQNQEINKKIAVNVSDSWRDIPFYNAEDVRLNWLNSIKNDKPSTSNC